jgi:SAM-dependent methyltransferase
MHTNNHDYIISGGEQGKSRLNTLSDVLYTYTKVLLEKQGVSVGVSFLDVGCGGGNVAVMVAEMAGDKGSVTAVDFDESIIALAEMDRVAAGRQNMRFEVMSAYDLSFDGVFDVVYARFLLSHLKEPKKVLQLMMRAARPGGKIIIEDVQFSGHFCYPACAAFDEYLRLYAAAARNNGADPEIGPGLPSLLHGAGLQNIDFDLIQPCFSTGPGKWMAYLTLEKIKGTVVAQGIADEQTIDKLLVQLKDFTANEHSIISLPRIFRAWGNV